MNWKILMSVTLVSGSAFAADGIKLGGFAEAAYDWVQIPGGKDVNSFTIPDGAFYFGKTMGMGEVLVDVPFRFVPGINLAIGHPNNNTILAGFDKAQAWLSWKYENGFMWKMGQFDSLYGYEGNDSVDNYFSEQGLVYGMMPVTHTGLELGYDFSDALGVQFLVANPYNSGLMTAGNADLGLKLVTKGDGFNASVGALFYKASTAGATQQWLIDIIAGSKINQLNLNIEVAIQKTAPSVTALGFLGAFTYDLSESVSLGLRPEYTKIDTANTFAVGFGPHFMMNKDFTIRPEYYFASVKSAGATTRSSQSALRLSAVHRF